MRLRAIKNEKWEDLRQQFPELYQNIPFECGIGWFNIIYALSEQIKLHIPYCSQPTIEEVPFAVQQIKEKYGTLRYYTNFSCSVIDELIQEAANLSEITCEKCGKRGLTYNFGWMYTRCPVCIKEKS